MPDRTVYGIIVYYIALVEDIKIGHLNLLVQLERPDHKLRKPVLLPPLLAGRLAAPPTLRGAGCGGLLRKSVIFFENIDHNHRP
jgi:hypothetical protein